MRSAAQLDAGDFVQAHHLHQRRHHGIDALEHHQAALAVELGGDVEEVACADEIHAPQAPAVHLDLVAVVGKGGQLAQRFGIGADHFAFQHEDIVHADRLDRLGLARTHVTQVPGTFTAQCFITTDLDDNQITAFHPGAMVHSHRNEVAHSRGVSLGIVSPDGREGMLEHSRQFAEAGIPFIFDPGQGLPMFNGNELLQCLQLADYCAVNDYEARLLCERTGRSIESLAGEVSALIVTLGGKGSEIHTGGRKLDIPCATPTALEDPTGCGDAYRAGLLYGIEHGMDWEQTGRLASLMGAIKIASRGGQNHAPDRDEIADAYRTAFGSTLW